MYLLKNYFDKYYITYENYVKENRIILHSAAEYLYLLYYFADFFRTAPFWPSSVADGGGCRRSRRVGAVL